MDKESLETVAATTAVATVVAKEIYTDGMKPAVTAVGKAVAGPITLLTVPFQCMGHAADIFIEKGNSWLDEKLSNVSEDERIAPKPNIAVPAITNILYNLDENELRNDFLNLLANSMSKQASINIHQSFPHILEEMSTNDALLFKEIFQCIRLPIAEIRTASVEKDEVHELKDNTIIGILASSDNISDIQQLRFSLDNLARLTLIKIYYSNRLVASDAYDCLENHKLFEETKKDYEQKGEKIYLRKGIIEITTMGKIFGKVVLEPPSN